MAAIPFGSLGLAQAAGGGAAAGAGALSFAAPLAIGFGVLGVISARKQNKFIRESARRAFESLDKQITQVRIKSIDDAMTISSQAQIEAGRAETAFGGVTGASVSTILGSFASDVASDTAVIRRNEEAALDAIEAQKEDVANQAGSQLKNPVLSGLMAGLSGFEAGLSLDSAVSQASRLKALKVAEDRLGAAGQQTGAIRLLNSMFLRDASSQLLGTRRNIFGNLNDEAAGLRSSVKRIGPVQ